MAQSSVARSVTANSALSGTIATEPRSAQGSARTSSRRVARPTEVGYVSCTPPAESRSGAHQRAISRSSDSWVKERHSEASVYTPALDLIAWPSPAAMPPFAAGKACGPWMCLRRYSPIRCYGIICKMAPLQRADHQRQFWQQRTKVWPRVTRPRQVAQVLRRCFSTSVCFST